MVKYADAVVIFKFINGQAPALLRWLRKTTISQPEQVPRTAWFHAGAFGTAVFSYHA